jgi:hypothetical protein
VATASPAWCRALSCGGGDVASGLDRRALSWLDRSEPLVPLVIEIMMDHPETLWGQGVYPVVK